MRYSQDVYIRSEQKLYDLRKKNQDDLDFRRNILYKRYPRAKYIEKELAVTALNAARAVINGSNVSEELNKLKDTNISLQNELKLILEKAGFPQDYLELKYKCSKCKDQGFIDGIMCSCMEKTIKLETYNDLNKISPLSLSTFESFSLDYYSDISEGEGRQSPRERISIILDYCISYAEEFKVNSPSIIMKGGTGLGKTHLSLAIANLVINRGFGVIYISTPNMVSRLEKERFRDASKFADSEEHFKSCQLLIIDDLGTEFSTPFSNAAIYNIINSRIMASKPTIISTNLSIKELEKNYTERMVSRIIGGNVRLEFIGNDIRQQKRMRRSFNKNLE